MSLKNFLEKCVPVSQDFHKKESFLGSFLGVLSNFHTNYFSEHCGEVGVS